MTHARTTTKPDNAEHVTIRRIYHVLRENAGFFEFTDNEGVKVWVAWSDPKFSWERIDLP